MRTRARLCRRHLLKSVPWFAAAAKGGEHKGSRGPTHQRSAMGMIPLPEMSGMGGVLGRTAQASGAPTHSVPLHV